MRIFLFILLSFTITPILAHEQSKHDQSDRPIEKWYYQLTIGKHFEKYQGSINTTIKRVDENTKSHRSRGEINLIGLYLPILNNNKSLLGVKYLSGGWDKYDDEVISVFFYGPSFAHYLDRIGRGLFVHADLGIANIVYNDSKIGEKDLDESGGAIRLGFGYAIPILKETSFLFAIHDTLYVFDIGKVNALSFNIGFLW